MFAVIFYLSVIYIYIIQHDKLECFRIPINRLTLSSRYGKYYLWYVIDNYNV